MMRNQRSVSAGLSLSLLALVSFASCSRGGVQTGVVLGAGMETSLDATAAKAVGGGSAFGAPIVGIQLGDGTRVVALCGERWCTNVKKGQGAEVAPVAGSEYWRVVQMVDQEGEPLRPGEGRLPLPHSMLPGYVKTIQNAGFECDKAQYGEFIAKAEYVRRDFAGSLEYCVTCKNAAHYRLLQSSDSRFQVLRCNDADCSACASAPSTPASVAPVSAQPSSHTSTETPITRMDSAMLKPTFIQSPDSRHVAFVSKKPDGGFTVFVDRESRGTFDEVASDSLLFASNGKRLAFRARQASRWVAVVDGKPGRPYDACDSLRFSPDGSRVAYKAKRGAKWFMVVDGREGEPYDRVTDFLFSPNGQRTAYVAGNGLGWFVILDDQRLKGLYDLPVTNLLFSPDSKQVAFIAGSAADNTVKVVVNGIEGKPFSDIGRNVSFSPDSRRLAYNAASGGKWSVVENGNRGAPYDAIGAGSLVFSPNSQRLAYVGRRGASRFVVVDGAEGKAYDSITAGSPVFSPDSRRLACGVGVGDKKMVVVDGREGKLFDDLGGGQAIVFSPNGQRIAYQARSGSQWLIVVDGVEGKRYDGIGLSSILFSPDSQSLAYGARLGDKWFAVFNGSEGFGYDFIFFGGGGRILFDSALKFHYIAAKGSDVYLVEGTAKI